MTARARQRNSLIFRCFLSCDCANLIWAFRIYIRPLLEYSSTVWLPSLKYLIDDIEGCNAHSPNDIWFFQVFQLSNHPWQWIPTWRPTCMLIYWAQFFSCRVVKPWNSPPATVVKCGSTKSFKRLLCNADTGSTTLLVSFDLSAAFDSINHNILNNRLSSCFDLTGLALDWIDSYLYNRWCASDSIISTYLFNWLSLILCVPKCMLLLLLFISCKLFSPANGHPWQLCLHGWILVIQYFCITDITDIYVSLISYLFIFHKYFSLFLKTPKVNRCLHVDIWYLTFDIGNHVICLEVVFENC